MSPSLPTVHDEHVGWKRGGHAQDRDDAWEPDSVWDPDDQQLSPLFIEFDDEGTEIDLGEARAATEAGGGPDGAVSSETVFSRPASRWSRIPLRYRVTAVAAALVLIAGTVTAVQLDRAARQRARERFALAVLDDRYNPSISEVGLNLGLTLVNHGPAPVTVMFLQVSQPGLRLDFYPVNVPLPAGKLFAFTLVGVFNCQSKASSDSSTNTVEVTVKGENGISSVTLGLKPGSMPPKGWQNQRSLFCASSTVQQSTPFLP